MPQTGVFFAEGMCFDSSLEGNGGPSQAASPIIYKAQRRLAWRHGAGQSEGPKPRTVGVVGAPTL
jgi:hypothetical protein